MADQLERLRLKLADRYALESALGSGGMATVYLAGDLRHGRRVAIKVLKPEIAALSGTERFLREVRYTAGLSHPNILPLLDSGQADGIPYFVTPYIKGESLRARLEREGQLPFEDAIRIAREVADALATAHEHGIVHRDIKPANILLEAGHAVVADFGIGLALADGDPDALTTAGVSLGTPGYMSPEQAMGTAQPDGRCDVYALGCVLYEMLAGERPYVGNTPQAVVAKQLTQPLVPIKVLRDSVPLAIESIVRRALAKSPADRFQTAGEFCDALRTSPTNSLRGSDFVDTNGGTSTCSSLFGHPMLHFLVLPTLVVGAALLVWNIVRGSQAAGDNIVVLAMQTASSTSEEVDLLSSLADELTWQLNSWDSPLVAASQASLTGAALDLGIRGPPLESLEDCRIVADAVDASRFVILTLKVHGDQADVQAEVRSPQSGVLFVLPSSGPLADISGLADPIAHEILGLPGPVAAMRALRRQSNNPAALEHFQAGRRQLRVWRLEQAEAQFREAIRIDGEFALAFHHLALTLYWQTERDGGLLSGLASRIGEAAEQALAYSKDLSPVDREHIQAFSAFWRGDYDGAREAYSSILQRDPSDVYGWLMLGTVEHSDMRLQRRRDGTMVPKANWNQAVRDFEKAVELSPDFNLGYGNLFEIHAKVIRALDHGRGFGFEPAHGELTPPWAISAADSFVLFYPVLLDSISWLSEREYATVDRERAERSIRRLEADWQAILNRWVRYAPNDVRPHEELAEWALQRLSRLNGAQPPERIRALAAEAVRHAEAAMANRDDTLPADLQRLASLLLGAGDISRASELADRSLVADSRAGGESSMTPRRETLNVLVARGQSTRALVLAEGLLPNRLFVPNSTDGEVITYGGAEGILDRLRILSATGTGGALLARTLREFDQRLSEPQYSKAERRLLKTHATDRIAAAFIAGPELLDGWMQDMPADDALWDILRTPTIEGTISGDLILSEVAAEGNDVRDPARSYMLAHAAQRAGLHSLAVQLFTRLDSLALPLDRFDIGWGLRPLSLFYRGKSYLALADTIAAQAALRRFTDMWRETDSETGLVTEAKEMIRFQDRAPGTRR